jgi:hypothetical protein
VWKKNQWKTRTRLYAQINNRNTVQINLIVDPSSLSKTRINDLHSPSIAVYKNKQHTRVIIIAYSSRFIDARANGDLISFHISKSQNEATTKNEQ